MTRTPFAPSLRQYELDQVHRVTALPCGSAESQPLVGTPLVKAQIVVVRAGKVKFLRRLALHAGGQPGHDTWEEPKNGKRKYHEREVWRANFGHIGNLLASHALQHEKVEPHGRRDLRGFHRDDKEYSEPKRVNSCGLDDRQHHAHGQNNGGDAVKETADQNVEHT